MQQYIFTERLLLRPFRLSDSERVAELAGEKIIADMTANIPYPYHPEMAINWIKTHESHFAEGKGVIYAITLKGSDEIIGAVSLPTLENGLGTLGYWLGITFWGRGIAFEASQALIRHSQVHLGLKELQVMHLVGNERSKSVIEKLGFEYIENQSIQVRDQIQEVSVYRSSF